MGRPPGVRNHAGRPPGMLDHRERVFVQEYLRDMNAGHAAVRAGFVSGAASRLMKKRGVADEIERLIALRSARTGITAERVLDELGNLAFANPADLFKADGTLKPWTELTADQAKMVGSVKTRRTVELGDDGKPKPIEVVEYAFVNKLAALTLAMRHLGLFNDHLSIEVGSLADRLAAAQARIGVKGLGAPQIEGEFEDAVEDLI